MLCIQYPSSQAYLQLPLDFEEPILTDEPTHSVVPKAASLDNEFSRGLGLFDSTMLVVGVMIGSGIFIVSAEISRNTGSPGLLLIAWCVAGALTIACALSYGELSGMMPHSGGMYVYLREAYSPLLGFLYGWTPVNLCSSWSFTDPCPPARS